MNFIDRLVSFIDPAAGLKRSAARVALNGIRGFEAAGRGRRTDGWKTTSQTAQEEISVALPLLRQRSRDMANNNPWAKKALEVIANNTVGTGIRPRISGKRAASLFRKWSESTICDFDGRLDFYGLQWHVMHTVAKSGECLVIKRMTQDGPRLQVLEGDFLDQGKNYTAIKPDQNYTLDGVEFDKNGQRIGYWIYDVHPMLYKGVSQKYDAKDVLHIYDLLRPGQVRGVPFGVSGLLSLRDFDLFEDAVLLRQQIANLFAVFITDPVDSSTAINSPDEDPIPDSLEPGVTVRLGGGKDVKFATPPSADGYAPYARNQLLRVAAAYGITYEALTQDLSNVNFSSGRMGHIEFKRNLTRWQNNIMINLFCRGVWQWFAQYAAVSGFGNLEPADWTPPKLEMIDPQKEITAMGEAVRLGFQSMPDALRELGRDPERVLEEIAEWNQKVDTKQIKITTDPRNFPLQKGPMQPEASGSQSTPKKSA